MYSFNVRPSGILRTAILSVDVMRPIPDSYNEHHKLWDLFPCTRNVTALHQSAAIATGQISDPWSNLDTQRPLIQTGFATRGFPDDVGDVWDGEDKWRLHLSHSLFRVGQIPYLLPSRTLADSGTPSGAPTQHKGNRR